MIAGKPLVHPARPSWDDYFLSIARAVAARGECLRSQVGAVLVDSDRRIIATGYNGVAPAAPSCLDGICPRAQNGVPSKHPYHADGRCVATHAEINAITDAAGRKLRVRGATMYLTKEPCPACSAVLTALALKTVTPFGVTPT